MTLDDINLLVAATLELEQIPKAEHALYFARNPHIKESYNRIIQILINRADSGDEALKAKMIEMVESGALIAE